MNILGFPTSQTFEATTYDDICDAFLRRSKVLMRNRKQMKERAKKNDKKSQKHGKIPDEDSCREEMLRLNEALQHLTRKKDKSEKGCFTFANFHFCNCLETFPESMIKVHSKTEKSHSSG